MTDYRLAANVEEMLRHSLRPVHRPGPGVVALMNGDPDFDTPEHIRRALAEAVGSGLTHYGPNQGDPELREVIAARLSRPDAPVGADQVLITHGSTAGISASVLAAVDRGDRVLIPTPTYSLYADVVRLAGGKPVAVPSREDLQLDMGAIAAAAPGARMIMICNPCNPTGAVYPPETMAELGRIAERHDLLVVADEAYDHLIFDGTRFISTLDVPELAGRVLYVQTFSKTYAMTGWRVGYLAGPKRLVDGALAVHRTFNGPANQALHRAALAALTGPQDVVEVMRREYALRRELVVELLHGIPGVTFHPPAGTFYAFLGYGGGASSVDVAGQAMQAGVAVRAGSEYGEGGDGHLRLSFATSRELLTEGISRLRPVLESQARD
jgi:aspartate aminotransferase